MKQKLIADFHRQIKVLRPRIVKPYLENDEKLESISWW